MNPLQVIGVYVLIPAAIYLVVLLLTVVAGNRRRRVRYRAGEAWDHPDQFWAGDLPVVAAPLEDRVGTRIGGARGSW